MACEHTNRCYGACCRSFVLNTTFEELREDLARAERGDKPRWAPEQSRKVLDSFVPTVEAMMAGDARTFTCRHLSTITGDCLNYENRPALCRAYPFDKGAGRGCTFSGCTWEEARNPPLRIGLWKLPITKYAADGDGLKAAEDGAPVEVAA